MSITEDELTSTLIDYFKQSTKELEEMDDLSIELNISLEASYNHYGNRGFVDLYAEQQYPNGYTNGYVFELKSESAVKQATGANEIIRQFNKMREYFFQGGSYSVPNKLNFELCFTPTEYNIRHICKNINMYQTSTGEKLIPSNPEDRFVNITIRPTNPETITPIIFSNKGKSMLEREEIDFRSYAEGANPIIYQRHSELIKEMIEKYSS